MSTLLRGAATLVASLGLGALAAAAPVVAGVPTVAIANYSFVSQSISIPVGGTVTWTNQDSVPHTVTSTDGGPLNSGTMAPGSSYSYTFTKAGTYTYHCSIHPSMTGTVVVTGAGQTPSPAPTYTPVPTYTPTMMMGGYSSPTPTMTPMYMPSASLASTPAASLPMTGPGDGGVLALGLVSSGGFLGAYYLSLKRSLAKRYRGE